MQDHVLYEKWLGTGAPWRVRDVDLRLKDRAVVVSLINALNMTECRGVYILEITLTPTIAHLFRKTAPCLG